jgi:L-lactate utilization protein LutC
MNDNKSPEEIKNHIQAQIVDLITRKLQSGEMEKERAKQIAQMILEKLSGQMSSEELIQVVPKLDDQFEELGQVIVPMMVEYEKTFKEQINQKIDSHLQEKNFDEVLRLAKEAIEKESQLT